MDGSYQELIILAKDGTCVGDIIKEENRLLYEFSSDENRQKIKPEHYHMFDDSSSIFCLSSILVIPIFH